MKFTIAHFFCGIGGKGLGAAAAIARIGDVEATFETIGGIDFDPLACRDFEMLVGAPSLCADVHKLEPADLIRFLGETAPDVVMLSPPCKGFSGLLSAKRAKEPKYQDMNALMERALFLITETWDPPPKLVFVENVPRIMSRGKDTIRRCVAMGHAAGYAIVQGAHDCGELGGLAQHRRRYFAVWRHIAQLSQLLYQPVKKRVRACGEVLGPLPMPGDVEAAGPMHAVPNLSWRNWVRLALIPAGGDWRDLEGVLAEGEKRREKFRRAPVTDWASSAETVTGPGGSASAAVADPRFGNVERVTEWGDAVGTITRSPAPSSGGAAVADPRFGLTCEPRSGAYGVAGFDEPAYTITGAHGVDNGRAAIADPRPRDWYHNVLRVNAWDDPTGTITGAPKPSSGSIVVADPRFGVPKKRGRHWNKYTVTAWHGPVKTVIGAIQPGSGAPSIADPRWGGGRFGVNDWTDPAGTVAGESLPNNGKYSVADPRFADGKKKNWQQVAGVTPWNKPAYTVTGGAKIHAGPFQVADPRIERGGRYRIMTLAEALALDLPLDKPPPFIPVIIAEDGTWHRPLTTLELAVLQSLPAIFNGKPLVLAVKGRSGHTRWREAIGNAVPPAAAEAIAEQMLITLLTSALGLFSLSNNEVWVRPHREALVA
jgi:site-specific DNA-cytosine methylase